MSTRPHIALIAAMALNRTIGADGELPWRLPRDLKHFKTLTTGHAMLMGRKTFESIGRPLPERRNLVLTRQPDWSSPGVEVVHSLDAALQRVAQDAQLFVIGGEQIYRLTLPLADELHLTLVHAQIAGDAHFPLIDEAQWQLVSEQHHPPDERHAHALTFMRYVRAVERRRHSGRSRG